MVYTGKLRRQRHRDGIHYGMFCRGSYFDFMDNLNCQLTEKIRFSVDNNNDSFKQAGRLKRIKDRNGRYVYMIDKKNIDRVFDNFCGQVVKIEMKNEEET